MAQPPTNIEGVRSEVRVLIQAAANRTRDAENIAARLPKHIAAETLSCLQQALRWLARAEEKAT